jgi:hypothetical protein
MDLYRKLLSVWPGNPLRPVKKGFAKEGLPMAVYSSTVLSAGWNYRLANRIILFNVCFLFLWEVLQRRERQKQTESTVFETSINR